MLLRRRWSLSQLGIVYLICSSSTPIHQNEFPFPKSIVLEMTCEITRILTKWKWNNKPLVFRVQTFSMTMFRTTPQLMKLTPSLSMMWSTGICFRTILKWDVYFWTIKTPKKCFAIDDWFEGFIKCHQFEMCLHCI